MNLNISAISKLFLHVFNYFQTSTEKNAIGKTTVGEWLLNKKVSFYQF